MTIRNIISFLTIGIVFIFLAKQDLITITGALSNFDQTSISVPHLERRANYYINNYAGGFTKHNVKENTLVISPSGKVLKQKTLVYLYYILV